MKDIYAAIPPMVGGLAGAVLGAVAVSAASDVSDPLEAGATVGFVLGVFGGGMFSSIFPTAQQEARERQARFYAVRSRLEEALGHEDFTRLTKQTKKADRHQLATTRGKVLLYQEIDRGYAIESIANFSRNYLNEAEEAIGRCIADEFLVEFIAEIDPKTRLANTVAFRSALSQGTREEVEDACGRVLIARYNFLCAFSGQAPYEPCRLLTR
ncbi:hypothetical protein HYS47_02705 [Candidatus Woesearchaeota archaeon]|nr:hypothetical protein [Candidatus Woesearchaeota archaeon]